MCNKALLDSEQTRGVATACVNVTPFNLYNAHIDLLWTYPALDQSLKAALVVGVQLNWADRRRQKSLCRSLRVSIRA